MRGIYFLKEDSMENEILRVENLHVSVEEQEILHGLDLTVKKGETHVLMGPNGAGKSTLGNALMGNPAYRVTKGSIFFQGKDIGALTVSAREGLFLSFQNPLEVPGITLESFIRAALSQRSDRPLKLFAFRRELQRTLEALDMDPGYAQRDLNVGFSGGEKKKSEILQLLMLKPTLAILDETDSGLDVDAVRTVSRGVEEYQKNQDSALLIITHSTGILSALHVDVTHVLVDGRIVAEGDASLIEEINRNGFTRFES